MLKYEVMKKETVPRQEALAAWPGNHKDAGPPVESTETIISGPYPNVSIAQVAEMSPPLVTPLLCLKGASIPLGSPGSAI